MTVGTTPAPGRTPPTWSGHVDVGALELYCERHGEGPPLVLLHGAFGTIDSCFAELLPRLAQHHEVIAPELQGHGHTPDTERPFGYDAMATDISGLLDALDIERAHLVGYSMGGAAALQLAVDQPGRIDRIVYAGGADFDTADSQYPEVTASFDESPDPHALDGTPWHEA